MTRKRTRTRTGTGSMKIERRTMMMMVVFLYPFSSTFLVVVLDPVVLVVSPFSLFREMKRNGEKRRQRRKKTIFP